MRKRPKLDSMYDSIAPWRFQREGYIMKCQVENAKVESCMTIVQAREDKSWASFAAWVAFYVCVNFMFPSRKCTHRHVPGTIGRFDCKVTCTARNSR